MAEPSAPASAALEAALADLAAHLDWPAAHGVAPAVAVRLRAPAMARNRRSLRPVARRIAAFALAAAVLWAALAAVSPSVRTATARWLGLDDVRISQGPAPRIPAGPPLDLGTPASLEEAGRRLGFPVRYPTALGPPDEVYVGRPPPGGQAALVYRAQGAAGGAGSPVEVLVTQFRGGLDTGVFRKVVEAPATVALVGVDGAAGFWIEGAHHIGYVDGDGRAQVEQARLAANVLMWERDGIVFRIESARSRAASLDLARSIPRG